MKQKKRKGESGKTRCGHYILFLSLTLSLQTRDFKWTGKVPWMGVANVKEYLFVCLPLVMRTDTSHLTGLLLRTQGSAVSNFVQFEDDMLKN